MPHGGYGGGFHHGMGFYGPRWGGGGGAWLGAPMYHPPMYGGGYGYGAPLCCIIL